ncbi:hypothetical protein [Methylobacterium brachythecii]|nr:hypothetical protein [Methylobacterium brachythecii]MBB3905591.1 hypothetical protein [Methylobacterium brachythecii]
MTPKLYLLACSVAVLTAVPAHGQSGNVGGFGWTKCTEFDAFVGVPQGRTAILGWAMGFMSGVNVVTTARDRSFRDLSGLNADLVIGSIRAFCDAHPDASVVSAVEALQITRPVRPFIQ